MVLINFDEQDRHRPIIPAIPICPQVCPGCNHEITREEAVTACSHCGRDLKPYQPDLPRAYAEDGLRDFGAGGRRW